MWPKPSGRMGKAPLTQFDNEPWVFYADAPKEEKAAAKEFLRFFFKKENYRRYCDSVPVHLLSIFKEDFADPAYMNHPERKRWKPWLDAQLKWVEIGRARSEEHTSELQSLAYLVCRLLLEKKKSE